MTEYKITCITKYNRMSAHEHITHVGNTSESWRFAREKVISLIEAGDKFYVVDSSTGKRAYVYVRRPNDGRSPFLQTYADSTWKDNLLSLPEC